MGKIVAELITLKIENKIYTHFDFDIENTISKIFSHIDER